MPVFSFAFIQVPRLAGERHPPPPSPLPPIPPPPPRPGPVSPGFSLRFPRDCSPTDCPSFLSFWSLRQNVFTRPLVAGLNSPRCRLKLAQFTQKIT